MRARYVSLLVAGAVVATAAVGAMAGPGDPAGPGGPRGWTSGRGASSQDPMDEWEGDGPMYGMQRGRGGPWLGRGGAWHGRGGLGLGGPGAGLLRGDGPLADELKLTGAQRQKLREIGDALERNAIQARADVQLARLDLTRMIREDSPQRARIESQIDTIAKLRAEMMKAAVRARLDARGVLTADQRKQLEERRGSRRAGRGAWR